MKTAMFLLLGWLTAGVASAQNLSIAKDQAKRAAGTAPAGQTPATQHPAAAQPAPTDPVLAATMKNLAGLRADLTAVSAAADASAAADQRVALLNHLSSAAQGTKASVANVRKLAADLIQALAGRKKVAPQAQKLGGAIHALFNGAKLSETQLDALLKDVTKILTDAEVPAADAEKVTADLKAIAAETK